MIATQRGRLSQKSSITVSTDGLGTRLLLHHKRAERREDAPLPCKNPPARTNAELALHDIATSLLVASAMLA
jgi:hypothetical protein